MTTPEILPQVARQICAHSPDLDKCDEIETKVAIALVLYAVIPIDGKIRASEKDRMIKLAMRRFGIETDIVEAFWALNETQQFSNHDFEEIAAYLTATCSRRRLLALIRDLWDISVADNELNTNEEAMIYRFADLVGIPRRDVIAQQARVCQ